MLENHDLLMNFRASFFLAYEAVSKNCLFYLKEYFLKVTSSLSLFPKTLVV